MPKSCYVVHAQFVSRRVGQSDKTERSEWDTFRAAFRIFKTFAKDGWHAGMFYYDADGNQQRLHASEHYSLLRDVAPIE